MTATAATREPAAGLFAGPGRTPVPLRGARVRAEILGRASRVVLAQRFRNDESVPIEAVYVFPLPEAAAVCGLAMRVGERRIEGEVWEREKAFERYDDALADGHGAVLLEEERPNVFTASVGNLLPGQEAVIELTWVAELGREGDALRFQLPTTVAPRYAPAEDRRGVSPTPAERVSPPVELAVPYGFSVEVEATLPSGVRAVDSPSHPVRVEIDGARARVALSHETAAMDRDFVLLLTPKEPAAPQALAERNADGHSTVAVSFVPELAAESEGAEVVFLVDRSGSMADDSIAQVRNALELCLRGLRAGDRFNIVGFGSRHVALFPESRAYDQAALDEASAHVQAMDADLGGTEVLPALRSILEAEPAAGMARSVVLLTDGDVSNDAAVIELAGRHRAHTRIFTFGIGYGASEHLVRAVARASGGEAEMISAGERIEPKVVRQFARLGRPALRDVAVEWGGARALLAAPYAPAAFSGEPLTVYARLEGTPSGSATLFGTVGTQRVSWAVPFDAAGAGEGTLLATLAARAAIRDLEEGTSALQAKRAGSAQRGRREDAVAKAIVDLATEYTLSSTLTSFVAIETREGAEAQPAPELRRVPVALTHGWGGIADAQDRSAVYLASLVSPVQAMSDNIPFGAHVTMPASSYLARRAGAPIASSPTAGDLFDDDFPPEESSAAAQVRFSRRQPEDAAAGPDHGSRIGGAPAPQAPGPHLALVRLQRADGSWKLDAKLAAAIEVDLDALRRLADGAGGGTAVASYVATFAAVRFLQEWAVAAEAEWGPARDKAMKWLSRAEDALPPAASAAALREEICRIIPEDEIPF